MKISFVIPCYKSENTISSVVCEIKETMNTQKEYEYEILLVNDYSPDGTKDVIKQLSSENDNVYGILLSKNFGQHSAIMAGLNHVSGDIIVCLDDDGQTPADEAFKLINAVEKGADVAYARYENKMHSRFRNIGSSINDRMMIMMLSKPKELKMTSYFAAKRFVIDEVIKYTHAYPYMMGLVLRTTRNIVNVDVTHRNRQEGESGYSFSKLVALWCNGFTAFSIKPLRIATMTGTFSAIVGFLYGIYTIFKKIFLQPDNLVIGFSALMSVIVFMSGLILLMMGLIGEYLGRTYISMNNSPQYVISERIGFDDNPTKK